MVKNCARRGQSVVEYVAVLSVILAAIVSTGIIERVHAAFTTYFDAATHTITTAK